jgi:hypothetical protein
VKDKEKNNRDEFISFRFSVISGIEFLGAAVIYLHVYIIRYCIKNGTALGGEPSERERVSGVR